MLNKITKFISRSYKQIDSTDEVISILIDKAETTDDIRYLTCADCKYLKRNFTIFGIVIKRNTPTCGECGCIIDIKIKSNLSDCPKNKWWHKL